MLASRRRATLLAFCSSWVCYVGCSQETNISQQFSLTSAPFHPRRKKTRNPPQLLSLHHHQLSVSWAVADTTVNTSHMEAELPHTQELAAVGTWLFPGSHQGNISIYHLKTWGKYTETWGVCGRSLFLHMNTCLAILIN